jgi:hypothetical protein
VLARLIERTHAVVNAAQRELNFSVFGRGFSELLIVLDGFLVIAGQARVVGNDQVTLARGKIRAQVFGFAGGLFCFRIATERGIGLRKLRIGERKVGIFLDRGLKTSESVRVVAPPSQIQASVIRAKGFDRRELGRNDCA